MGSHINGHNKKKEDTSGCDFKVSNVIVSKSKAVQCP